MMKRRIFYMTLLSYDNAHDACTIRELEMAVDAAVFDQGYAIQFWRDVWTYGVDEALLYLTDHASLEGFEEVRRKWKEIRERIVASR